MSELSSRKDSRVQWIEARRKIVQMSFLQPGISWNHHVDFYFGLSSWKTTFTRVVPKGPCHDWRLSNLSAVGNNSIKTTVCITWSNTWIFLALVAIVFLRCKADSCCPAATAACKGVWPRLSLRLTSARASQCLDPGWTTCVMLDR